MRTKELIAALALIVGPASSALSQQRSIASQLADKPKERIFVLEVELPELASIIETTALKMNYDSVVVNSAQDKVLAINSFADDERQYRILLRLAALDSVVELTFQSFWFLPPDSIPRSSKAMREWDRNYSKLFLYAIVQEIALRKSDPLYDKALPGKSFLKFTGLNLLNPGLASWYIMKDNPTIGQKPAIGWSLFLGILDLGYMAYAFVPAHERENGQVVGWARDISTQHLAAMGAIIFRSAMTIGYFVDQDYHHLKKSGYFFPKVGRLNFDTKYTRYIKQSDEGKKANFKLAPSQ